MRLPDNLFMQTSGIEVGSDLLIFQKNTRKATLSNRERMFTETMQEMVDTDGTPTEYFNKYFTLPNTTLSTESRIATNQFGKFVRKYQWQNGEQAMTDYLLKVLTHNFDLCFDKGLFAAPEKAAEPMQLSLFGDLFGDAAPAPKPNLKSRPYTDAMLWWMKDGTLVEFGSLYSLDGSFDRNAFYVEGKSGLKYPCGTSGSLPLSFAESVAYPQTALDRLPAMIERQQRSIAQLESELPTLGAIVARQWSKSDELAALRSEREALQKRIDETLKEAERKNQPVGEAA